MYGTMAICKVKAENREKMQKVMLQYEKLDVPGYLGSEVMFPNNHDDTMVLVARFADKASYEANADDPAQHERYVEYRALMEADPEWYDGDWLADPNAG